MVIHAALCAPLCAAEYEEDGIVTVFGGGEGGRGAKARGDICPLPED